MKPIALQMPVKLTLLLCGALALSAPLGCAKVLGFERGTDANDAGGARGDAGTPASAGTQGYAGPDADGGAGAHSQPGSTLSKLIVSAGVLEPEFSSDVHDYVVRLTLRDAEITVTPQASYDEALVLLSAQGVPLPATAEPPSLPLALGVTEVTVDVTAEGVEAQQYRVKIDRASPLLSQTYVKASNSEDGDRFGSSVAISGNTLVVGAPYEDADVRGVNGDQADANGVNSGAAYVFVRSGSSWVQQAYLKASNSAPNFNFGGSVAIYGDTIAIGSSLESSLSRGVDGDQYTQDAGRGIGAVYVFERVAGSWAQQAYLKPSNSVPHREFFFGASLSLYQDVLAVGAPRESYNYYGGGPLDGSGAVYVFARQNGGWAQQARLKASSPGVSDSFGTSVALWGTRLAVGAPGEDSNAQTVNGNQDNDEDGDSGAAYLFEYIDDQWDQEKVTYVKASNTRHDAEFGGALALHEDFLVVGAKGESGDGDAGEQTNAESLGSGAVYVFQYSGESWMQRDYVKASDVHRYAEFGSTVALWNDILAVGTPANDDGASGVSSTPGQSEVTNSGAVYLFAGYGTKFVEKIFVKASNPGEGDAFGAALALADGTLAVGAPAEASSSAGIDQDEANDNQPSSGAVYLRSVLATGADERLGLGALRFEGIDPAVQLAPAFSSEQLEYSVTVPADLDSVSLLAEALDPNARVSVNGALQVPHQSSAPISLGFGETDIAISVLLGDGRFDAYHVRVQRLLPLVDGALLDVSEATPHDEAGETANPLAISGDTIAVGVPFDDSDVRGTAGQPLNSGRANSGAVYVFVRGAGGWVRQAYLKASNADAGDHFGASLAFSGETLVVGAPGESSSAREPNGDEADNSAPNSGAVYVFVRSAGAWQQKAYLKASNADAEEDFGTSLALEGDRLLVGAPRENGAGRGLGADPTDKTGGANGAAYLFEGSGSAWTEALYVKASNAGDEHRFGSSVALSGETFAVGAPQENGISNSVNGDETLTGSKMGAVYVFSHGTSWGWVQEAYVKPWNAIDDKAFGCSLALAKNTLVVGAWWDASGATRVNGDAFNRDSLTSGAVFVYERGLSPLTPWSKRAYLKASNNGAMDHFGGSVALAGDRLLVGASWEKSLTNGVRATPDNKGTEVGAAYLFLRNGDQWSENAFIKSPKAIDSGGFGGFVALSSDWLAIGNTGYVAPSDWDLWSESHGSVLVMPLP